MAELAVARRRGTVPTPSLRERELGGTETGQATFTERSRFQVPNLIQESRFRNRQPINETGL
jgi:hypothetical protein